MIRLTQQEFDAHKARLAKLKAQGNVRTHRCEGPADQEVLGFGHAGKSPPNAPFAAAVALKAGVEAGKRSKHGAVKTVDLVDGERFDSKLEFRCWQALKLRQAAGEIRGLRRQVRFSLFAPGGEHLGTYKADFVWEYAGMDDKWHRVVADAKSPHTRKLPGWSRIKTLMRACHGIDVLELP